MIATLQNHVHAFLRERKTEANMVLEKGTLSKPCLCRRLRLSGCDIGVGNFELSQSFFFPENALSFKSRRAICSRAFFAHERQSFLKRGSTHILSGWQVTSVKLCKGLRGEKGEDGVLDQLGDTFNFGLTLACILVELRILFRAANVRFNCSIYDAL